MAARIHGRDACLAIYGLLSLAVFMQPLFVLLNLWWTDDRYSYVALMPLMSVFLIFLARKKTFQDTEFCARIAAPLTLVGMLLFWVARYTTSALSVQIGGLVLVWIAGFVLCFGLRATWAARFPLGLLLLTVPVPFPLMHSFEVFLQNGSADVAHWIFQTLGMPVFRNGLVFSFAGLDIKVAEQCSGIRSTTALLITVILASYLLLRFNSSRVVLILAAIPIAIFKNAVRIAALSWLGIHVSREVLHGPLHKSGGLPFTVIALAILGFLLFGLQSVEVAAIHRRTRGQIGSVPPRTDMRQVDHKSLSADPVR